MCVGTCALHVCMGTYVGTRVGGCTCMWRLEVDVKNPPSTLFHLVHGSRISQSDSEPVNMACLASQLALRIPCLCPPRLELQAATTPTWHLCGFSGPSSGSLSFMESSLTAESFPQPLFCHFLDSCPKVTFNRLQGFIICVLCQPSMQSRGQPQQDTAQPGLWTCCQPHPTNPEWPSGLFSPPFPRDNLVNL